MFDEQPDGDPHGECAAEIHRLKDALCGLFGLVQLVLGRDDLTAELRDVLCTNHRIMAAQRVLGVSLAGCEPLPKVFGTCTTWGIYA